MAGRVGLILVHGIGEQKRFAHLDSEIRGIIDGLQRRPRARITVEILSGGAATYNADQDTWASGENPSARVNVLEAGVTTEINVHEVWWADVNEPYSLAKQIRFWLWGLSIWSFPASEDRPDLPAYEHAMYPPVAPGRTGLKKAFVRFQLFLVGLFFFVAAFSLGVAVFLAKRLFGFEAPDFVKVFVNYISGVKLYNQSTRQGTGLLPNPRGFLDTLNDPPRVSIRRRMIQAIVAVAFRPAGQEYDRWYILGHSLGSIVSFNGIMEFGQAFANYLPRETWARLAASGWAGPPRRNPPHDPPDWVELPPGPMSPSRPVWLRDDDLVYRDYIFANFRGLLTYGSPLGKFAELWRARVPVNKVEPIFQPDTEWINVYDGRDPVSGLLKAFEPAVMHRHGITHHHCPPLRGFGYAASHILLLSHIRYLTTRRREPDPQLSDVVADWLLTGRAFTPPPFGVGRWYGRTTYRMRLLGSWVWWVVAFLILAMLGTITARGLWDLLIASGHKIPGWLTSFWDWLASHVLLWSWLGT
jgi:hypothetical protein